MGAGLGLGIEECKGLALNMSKLLGVLRDLLSYMDVSNDSAVRKTTVGAIQDGRTVMRQGGNLGNSRREHKCKRDEEDLGHAKSFLREGQ